MEITSSLAPTQNNTLPTINIIGAGCIGQTFGKLIANKKCGIIQSIVNSHLSKAKAAAKYIGQGSAVENIKDLAQADIYFITTQDEMIAGACHQLVEDGLLKRGSILVHCSGTQNLKVLAPAKSYDCHLARVHPIKHVSDIEQAVADFLGTFCMIECEDAAYGMLHALFTAIGGQAIRIDRQEDYLYHSACVFGTVLPQILLSACGLLYEACGIQQKTAIELSQQLMQKALKQIDSNKTYAQFIEGPIKRADLLTLQKNIEAIKEPALREIYKVLTGLGINLSMHNDLLKEQLKNGIHQQELNS